MNQIISDHDVALAMRSMGGSFATRLAECWLFADDQNRARLLVAFRISGRSTGNWRSFRATGRWLRR